jgi:hypothetical protein
MTSSTNRIARLVALPVVSLGLVGAALGLAASANAEETGPQTIESYVATPQTVADPAIDPTAGGWWHRHHPSLLDPATAAIFTQPGA